METVDGADVGEDSLNDITGEGGARSSLLQEPGTENLQEESRGGLETPECGGRLGHSFNEERRIYKMKNENPHLSPGP